MDIQEKDGAYIAHTYSRQPVCFIRGKGSLLYDEEGREYIDLSCGIGVTALGFSNRPWIDAVTAQVHTLNHISNLYHTIPQVELAELLCRKAGMKKVFFSNSGAEANECAIKAARKYSIDKYNKDRNIIVTLLNSFHGRTVTTLSATGQEIFHKDFYPFTDGFLYTPADDLDAFIRLVEGNKNICAIMVEPIQGESGVHPLARGFLQGIADYAASHDILLICDEVQSGNGRSGALYAYMDYGVHPDIVTTAKGLGGGLPIGATMFNEKTENVLTPGTHGSTFGGNPICAAGACAILSQIDDALLQSVNVKGNFIKKSLIDAKNVEKVEGMGLMLGIKTGKPVQEIITRCLEKGVVVLSAKDKIRLLPALNIPMDTLEKGIALLKEAIEE